MPAKKGSIDGYNIKQKVLDGARYIGKNFWKVLPVGSAINYQDKLKLARRSAYFDTSKEFINKTFHGLYALAGIYTLVIYGSLGVVTGVWTPKQMKAYNEKARIKQQIETEHKSEVNHEYNQLFENAKTSEDTLAIYKRYNLPFKFVEPTLKQKEEAIKQNKLERSLK
jgi:hypothetical protein